MMAAPEPVVLPVAPHSIDAEQSVLGALLIDNNAFGKIADLIADADFYRDDHRRIFRHVFQLIERDELADAVTVGESINASEDRDKTGGLSYLAQLISNTPSAYNVRRYAEIVVEHARRRELQALANEIHDKAAHGEIEEIKAELIERATAIKTAGTPWPALDLESLAEREPVRPGFIVSEWGPTGYAWLFAGHGGSGKSIIGLYLAICIAAGMPFFGVEVARRRVMYLSCEDRENVLHWRLSRICSHHGINLANLRAWLEIVDLVGKDSILWERDPRTGSTVTAAYELLKRSTRAHQTEVLMVDGIADTFGGNENARGDVKRFVNSLVALIPPDRGAVLLVAHVAKPTAASGSTSEGYSGSTGWNNSVRARWYLRAETTDSEDADRPGRTGALVLELQKSNLGRADQSMRFTWDDDAHLFLGELVGASAFDRRHQDREERAGALKALQAGGAVPAATTGRRTAYHVLAARSEFPDSLRNGKASVRRFWRHIEELRAMGLIREGNIRRGDRHYIAALELTPEGVRACGQ